MRLLLADDHDLVRSTLAGLLREHGGYAVTEASDMWQGFSQIEAGPKPDLALLDFSMPGMSIPEGLTRAVKMMSPAPVALLTGTGTPGIARRAMDLGAKGFLTKNMLPEELLVSVRKLLNGESVVVDHSSTEESGLGDLPHLTPRELDVLRGLCNGLSNKEIARELEVQEVTVKLHVKTLSRKLDAKNRTHAAMLGRDMHLV
ncbi:MAG: DNA-binding response regulator [Rhodobacteraceae bacterium]|jgi:two-component system nitrate/nitrite response regulator NarL|nr:DNA-binding response regulator [Paracoccaceae bacterium]